MTNAPASRILTLVFTDLADSTALKTEHGDASAGELIARHREHVTRLAADSGGRIIDWAGDGCFLTFDTSSAGVLFSLRLQETHHWESMLPGVRVGIHMGEVTEKPFNGAVRVEGLLVDLTARISGLASPGQILISSAAQQSAKQRLDADAMSKPIRWESYGPYTLKGFDEPVDVRETGLEGISPFTAPAGSEKAWPVSMGDAQTREKEIRKIAVLPFTSFSETPEQDWFVDGMTETLIAELAKIKALTVISRTSVMHYKQTNKPLREIARELDVQALVEGSVMRAGNRLRITAQLIDAESDAHLFADQYDGTIEDIFDLQATVALAIAKEVNVALTPEESAPLEHQRPVIPEAFDALMKSKYALSSASGASFDDAMSRIHKALSIDPEYADAHAFLAAIYAQHLVFGNVSEAEAYFRARISAKESIRLGGENPTALWALAHIARIVEWDWDLSLEYALRAAALNPSQSEIMAVVGVSYSYKGDTAKAREYLDRAIETDPLDPRAYVTKGVLLVADHRFDEAIAFARDAMMRFPGFELLRVSLATAWLGKGAFAEASAVADEIVVLQGEETRLESIQLLQIAGVTFALTGREKDAEGVLDKLRKRYEDQSSDQAHGVGLILLALGRQEEAYPLLERSYHNRSFLLLWFNLVHVFERLPFELDDRIKRLFARMNIATSPW